VLITGAGSGIASATVICFARRGAKLSLTGRNQVNLQRVGDELDLPTHGHLSYS